LDRCRQRHRSSGEGRDKPMTGCHKTLGWALA
jgi:hypothetical protein